MRVKKLTLFLFLFQFMILLLCITPQNVNCEYYEYYDETFTGYKYDVPIPAVRYPNVHYSKITDFTNITLVSISIEFYITSEAESTNNNYSCSMFFNLFTYETAGFDILYYQAVSLTNFNYTMNYDSNIIPYTIFIETDYTFDSDFLAFKFDTFAFPCGIGINNEDCKVSYTITLNYIGNIWIERFELVDDLLQIFPLFIILFIIPAVLYYKVGKFGFSIGLILSTILAIISSMVTTYFGILMIVCDIAIIYFQMKQQDGGNI